MDGQAARVAQIGDMVEQLQRIDEAPPGFAAARQFEADEAAKAAGQQPGCPFGLLAGLGRGVDHLHHIGAALQEAGDLQRLSLIHI